MSLRQIYAIVVVAIVALISILFTTPLQADETVKFECSSASQNLDISVNDQEKVKWKESSNPPKEFRIEFDKASTVQGRKSPFKSCFIFCVQKTKIAHENAIKGNKIKVKPKQHGKYNYTIYCANGIKIDPMIQVPRSGVPTPH